MEGAFSWKPNPVVQKGHSASVEDIQWSPVDEPVFISASADGTIKVWDIRAPTAGLSFQAHDCDVNVISWNTHFTNLLVSGADDGSFRVWDLSNTAEPIANYQWHHKSITSLEWSPHEESGLIVSSDDNTISLWDFSVEEDAEGMHELEVPPQLMFVHQGQTEIKVRHCFPHLPCVAFLFPVCSSLINSRKCTGTLRFPVLP